MADVLGKYSFLDTPDVNGVNVLLVGEAATSATGVTNQILITGTTASPIIGLANNPVLPGIGAVTVPSGATADRPAVPGPGMVRFNTTSTELEFFDGTSWYMPGNLLQTITGTITASSSNVQIPFDATTPLSTEGVQLWTQSFTPLRADSTILIMVNSFYTVNSASDVYTSGAVFSGTTCIYSQLLGFTTNTGNGSTFSILATTPSANTTARTYSFRCGPNVNATVFYAQGITNQNYGSTTNSGRYVIQEIAP